MKFWRDRCVARVIYTIHSGSVLPCTALNEITKTKNSMQGGTSPCSALYNGAVTPTRTFSLACLCRIALSIDRPPTQTGVLIPVEHVSEHPYACLGLRISLSSVAKCSSIDHPAPAPCLRVSWFCCTPQATSSPSPPTIASRPACNSSWTR